MEYGNVAGIAKPVSRLVQGGVMLSRERWDQCSKLLDDVLERGCTAFDTAHGYGGGESERTLGRWIADRGVREKVVIITKGAHPSKGRKRVTPLDITHDLIESLHRLETDHIDLYLLHRDDPDVAVGPIVDVLNEHKKAGRIHAFGGSNWTPERLAEANAYAESTGQTPFAASSPNFTLARQQAPPWDDCLTISGPENAEARAWYQQAGMPLFCWSSLAGGFFSERFTRDNLDSFTGGLDATCVKSYCFEENFKRLDRVKELAAEKNVTVPQVALAWVMGQPLDIYALVGCATGDEFIQNVEALELKLTEAECAWLDLARATRT